MRFSLCGLAALILALVSVPAHAQTVPTVQSTLTLSLTAQVTMPVATGSRIVRLRLGTRDLIEQMKEDLGISGKGGTLVRRRAIDDFDTPGETWLIVAGQEYFVPDPLISEIDVELPESFFAEVEAVKRRASDDVETSGSLVMTDAFAGGDIEDDGFEMTLVGIETISVRLLTQKGADIGYLVTSDSVNAMGGMLLDLDVFGVVPGVITGTIRAGAEKIVTP